MPRRCPTAFRWLPKRAVTICVDEYSVNVIAKFDGRVINKGVRTVAADGMTMKIEVGAIDQGGNEVPFSLVFKRVVPT